MRYPRILLCMSIAVIASASCSYGQRTTGSSTAIHPTKASGVPSREEALELFLKRDARATPLLTKLADGGDAFAQWLLFQNAGECESGSLKLARDFADQGLRQGYGELANCDDPTLTALAPRGGLRDREKAIAWRRLAREAKLTPKARGDFEKGFNLLRQKAEAGNGMAQYLCYWMGLNFQLQLISYGEAQHWLELAAENGIPEAEYTLSQYYGFSNQLDGGPGHVADDKLSALWMRKAAALNYEPAQIFPR